MIRAYVRPQLAWALAFSLVVNLALLAPSLFMLQVYDRVLVTRSVETLLMLAALAAMALVAFGALDQVRSRLLTVLGMALERRFGPAILSQLIVATARQNGAGVQDGLRDLSTLRAFLSGPAVVALFDTPWAVVYLALIAAFDWRLGLLAVAAAMVLITLTWANDRTIRAGLHGVQADARAATRWAERSLHNAEVVTALGMSQSMSARWAAQTVAMQEQSLAVSGRSGVLSASTRTLRQMVQVMMLGTGAFLVIREGATPGVMIATTIILGRALAPVEQLIAGWNTLAEARAAHARLNELLSRAPEGGVATALPRPTGHVSVEHLAYAVAGPAGEGSKVLLRNASLQLAPGEILALVGGSGAGKTTLARLLVGVLKAGSGSVRLDGADIRQYDPQRLGPALGYLPQDVELFAGTVAENIARFTDEMTYEKSSGGRSDAVIAAAQAAGAHDFILRLPKGYDTPVGESGRSLSGGQRQRVALARALFGEPALVVLDEPDASLDAEGEDALVAALQRLKARGAAVVAVTQRRRLLSIADKVVVMRDGAIERTVSRSEAGGELAVEPAAVPTAPAPAESTRRDA